jgi:hypothetical protein
MSFINNQPENDVRDNYTFISGIHPRAKTPGMRAFEFSGEHTRRPGCWKRILLNGQYFRQVGLIHRINNNR